MPLAIIVIILHLTITPLEGDSFVRFLVGVLFIIIGLPLFLLGIDISIELIGQHLSKALIQSNMLWILVGGIFFLGFIISIAEPDLGILAQQVNDVTSGQIDKRILVLLVSLGIGLFLAIGILRIIKGLALNHLFLIIYLLIFVLSFFSSNDFLAIAFDASGSTTGSITVPFMLALATGASNITRSKKKQGSDSFGVLGIASTGAIIAVLVQGLFSSDIDMSGSILEETAPIVGKVTPFFKAIPHTMLESITALIPILIVFFIINAVKIHLSKRELANICKGLIYTVFGLILFLVGVNVGFMDASRQVGYQLAALDKPWLVLVIGMLFGFVTIPAEPSVHVLTDQIENETGGSIKANLVMYSLSIGVAIAVGLSLLRILIPILQLWQILLPGLLISIILSYYVPEIFVGIAYDSGGVAAGTMTATFILPYAQGVADFIPSASVMLDGFGVIALVAMTPVITIQILGLIYKIQTKPTKERIS